MSTVTIVLAVLVVLALIAVGFALTTGLRYWRSRQLRSRFGPEYERLVEATGDRGQAERSLEQRVERRRELKIRELSPADRDQYAGEWRAVQSRFLDDPRGAVDEADALVSRVMTDRGYPEGDFEQHAADVSVDHAVAVPGYRSAHAVLLSSARSQVATDDLRQAMVHYRELFAQLLGEPPVPAGTAGDRGAGSDDAESSPPQMTRPDG
ncbi:MAG TPA: hypothetical protein VKF59_07580 [Candidatus Dormibacteraeota bacterium]|nr:hypothetical protein [Candidatus Dormibacteraeota bacterium]